MTLKTFGIIPRAAAALAMASSVVTDVARAASGDRIGDAVVVVNTVFADFDRTQRTLNSGDEVRQDEVIEVAADSQSEIKLDDDTKLALGPGARLVLDKFVYDSDKKAGSIVLDLAKGAFRFITGVAAKPTYVINTPNASITVRGTIFDVYILQDQSVWLLLHEGAVEVTGKSGACRVLDQPGRLLRITSDGVAGLPVDWSKLEGSGAIAFDAAFPFVEKPPQVDPEPRLTRAAIVASDLPDASPQPCAKDGGSPPVKMQRAGGDGANPPVSKKPPPRKQAYVPPPKKRVYKQPVAKKPVKVVKRQKGDPNAAAKAAAAAVIIGIGVGVAIGGFGKNKHKGGGGGEYPKPR